MKTKTATVAAAMTTISGRSFKYAAVEAERHHMPQNGQTEGGTDGRRDGHKKNGLEKPRYVAVPREVGRARGDRGRGRLISRENEK